MIRNSLDQNVFLQQIKSTTNPIEVKANSSHSFYFWDKKGIEQLTLRIGEKFNWCGGFSVNSVDNIKVKSFNQETHQVTFFGVSVTQEYGTSIITIYQDENPPYLIENDTSFPLFYLQKEIPTSQEKLDPHTSRPFTWEEHSKKRILQIFFEGKKHLKSLKMDSFIPFDPVNFQVIF